MKRFRCKNKIGLLGGTYAEMFYSNEHQKYYVVINQQQMGYKNEIEALRDLRNAGFEEVGE